MLVVLTRSVDGAVVGMPFDTSQSAMNFARREAWVQFDGRVDEVEVFRIDETDRRVAKERVERGEGHLLHQVDQELSADRIRREEVRDAGRFLASIGLGSTSLKKS